jgi:hypothetical protein
MGKEKIDKIKLNGSIMAVLLLATFFAGWEYMILVTAIIYVFCSTNERLKNLALRVVTLNAACSLLSLGWNIIENWIVGIGFRGVGVLQNFIQDVSGDTYVNLSWMTTTTSYINSVVQIVGILIAIFIATAKFKFILNTITNRPPAGMFKKLDEFMNNFLNFFASNLYEEGAMAQQPMAQQPQMPMPNQNNFQQPPQGM